MLNSSYTAPTESSHGELTDWQKFNETVVNVNNNINGTKEYLKVQREFNIWL